MSTEPDRNLKILYMYIDNYYLILMNRNIQTLVKGNGWNHKIWVLCWKFRKRMKLMKFYSKYTDADFVPNYVVSNIGKVTRFAKHSILCKLSYCEPNSDSKDRTLLQFYKYDNFFLKIFYLLLF